MYEYKTTDMFAPGETVSVSESYFIPNALVPHSHDYFEIAYIYSGSGFHELNGIKHPIKQGDIFFVSKNSVHNFTAEDESLKWLNIMFLPKAFNKNIVNASNAGDLLSFTVFSGIFHLSKVSLTDISLYEHEQEFEKIIFNMRDEYFSKLTGYQEILQNYLSIVLLQIFRLLSLHTEKKEPRQDNLANLLIDYLQAHVMDENIKLDEIAQKAFVSPNYFPNLFKKKTGMSVTKFIHRQKMSIAAEALRTTNKPVVSIMNEIGYSDTKFFYRLFARHYDNLTPGEYRQHHSKP